MVLAISAGALRKLLLNYDGQADHPLLASVPVSFDFSRDRISGNYFTGVLMAVPVDLEDPLERVRAAHDAAVDGQGEQPPDRARTGQPVGGLFPAGARPRSSVPWLSNKDGQNKVLNLPISNVPGPREHGRVGGALVTEIYSVGSADGRQRAEHHGVELRRPAQHLGAVRRRDARTTRTS